MSRPSSAPPSPLAALLLALLLMAAVHAVTRDVDFDLTDEGFVWYGVQRTAAGEVPLRDFQSYEPGRYLWGAAWSFALGDGILALRLSTAIFGALGLFGGLLAARRAAGGLPSLALFGAVLAAWMVPRHKLFEPALAMLAVWVAVRLVERPDPARHFQSGLFAGAAACIGRNHGLYAALGLLLLIGWRRLRVGGGHPRRELARFGAGLLLGFAPLLAAMTLVPRFGASFLESVLFFVVRGSNVPQPFPWPWRAGAPTDWAGQLAAWAVAAAFALLALVYATGLTAAWTTRRAPSPGRALLIAASCVGLFYAHHAAVRADASHLAQCIAPMWLALFALPRAYPWLEPARPPVLALAAVLTLFALPAVHPALARHWPELASEPLVRHAVGGDALRLPVGKARQLAALEAVLRERVGPGEGLFVAPAAPGLYALLRRAAPVWDLYFLWPADAGREQRIVAGLDAGAVAWALIQTDAPFGREDLRLENSHPRVWEYLMRRYRPVDDPRLPPGTRLFSRAPASAR